MKLLNIILIMVISLIPLNAEETQGELPGIPTLSIDADKAKTQEANASNPASESTPAPTTTENAIPDAQTNPMTNSKEPTGITANLTQNAPENETKGGRDPFTPLITPKDSGQITNAPQLNLFTKAELNLPSTARKIKKITIEYQNLNGSITALESDLEGDIDWHFPLVLSQEVQPKEQGIPERESFPLSEHFEFEITHNNIFLNTNLTLLRDFTLASPTRLVLDFKAPNNKPVKETFLSKIPAIPKVTLSTHLDFYRITLDLDGQYKYNLTQDTKAGNYNIELY